VLSEYTRQATLASWNGKTNTGILDHAHEGHETFHGAAQISCCVEESCMTHFDSRKFPTRHFDSRPGCHTGLSLPSKKISTQDCSPCP